VNERTSEHMTDEQALEEYLKRGSSISQRYRESAAAVVPAHLDERVLALARAASGKAKSRRWVRWTAPLAVAASAILALSIVLDQGAREHAAVSKVEAPASAAPEERAELRTQTAPQPPAQERPNALLDAPAAPATKAEAPPVAAAREVAPAFAPTPEPERSDEKAAQTREMKKQLERESTSARRAEERAASTPAPHDVEETVASRHLRSIEGATSQAISSVVATDAAQVEAAAPAADALHNDPDRWLTQIRKLREQGRNEEADQEWKRFREAYPDYPVADSDVAKTRKE
jgi:hypothetical protein